MKDAPIGFFDSGVGGLTIWDPVVRLLPGESTLYLADSANAPYGERSPQEILRLSRKNTQWLLDAGCKLVVVACNTATTNAIAALRREFQVSFIGIEPAIKPAALQSRSGKVGVLATRGTLASSLFATTSGPFRDEIRILERDGEGLVAMIESGQVDDAAMRNYLQNLLAPMLDAGIDHLVLGCTHYPFLEPVLRQILPPGVEVVDCGGPVARQCKVVLEQSGLLRSGSTPPVHQLITNGNPAVMGRLLKRLGHDGLKPEYAAF